METAEIARVREERLNASKEWLLSAKRELESFKNETRHKYIPFVRLNPKHPQKAIECLALCVEKAVKSVALASGKFNYGNIENYSHKSLKLCADILENLLDFPVAKEFANSIQGQIVQDPRKGKFLSHREAIDTLEKIKNRIFIDKNKTLSEWAYQWATLPQKTIEFLVKDMMNKRRSLKIAGFVLSILPVRALIRHGIRAEDLGENLLSRMEIQGFQKSQEIRDYFQKEKIRQIFAKGNEEVKLSVFKHGKNFIMLGWILDALLILSAFTSPHGTLPRYPKEHLNNGEQRRLAESSYDVGLGIVACMLKVANLADITLKEIGNNGAMLVDTFLFYELKSGNEANN